MCGLFASIGLPPDPARIDIVAHRGPDGRGWKVHESGSGPVALGHRRLAIIDLSDAGLQPMSDPTGRYHLLFNGEIYNYRELRREMADVAFVSESDAEVLLQAFVRWGFDCLPRLRGMFAFLVWDSRTQRLHVARDRYGIKPLYFTASPGGVAFASEIKQLVGLQGVSGRMNRPRVRDFLLAGMSDHTDETMFDGVRQIRGGEWALVEASGPQPTMTIRRWHAINYPVAAMDEASAVEGLRRQLDEAVSLHLRSDVAVGSCLSGGLDSSSLVCLMAQQLPGATPLHTFSACYSDRSVDERPYMEAVVAATGAEAHYIYPRAEDVFAAAELITWHQDEPFGSTSILAQWSVFAAAKEAGIKVMLDGQGADEILGGYHFAFPYHIAGLLRSGQWGAAASTVLARRRIHDAPVAMQMARLAGALLPDDLAGRLRGMRHAGQAGGWLAPPEPAEEDSVFAPLRTASRRLSLEPPNDLAGFSQLMLHASNLPMLLHWEDRNSMAHSVEARVPFLDHVFVDFAMSLDAAHKMAGADTKRVLRRAMAGVLPPAVAERKDKLGFATPETPWLREALAGQIRDGVEASLAYYPDLFDVDAVRAMRDAMLDGRRPVDSSLWRIVNLGMWGRCFRVAA